MKNLTKISTERLYDFGNFRFFRKKILTKLALSGQDRPLLRPYSTPCIKNLISEFKLFLFRFPFIEPELLLKDCGIGDSMLGELLLESLFRTTFGLGYFLIPSSWGACFPDKDIWFLPAITGSFVDLAPKAGSWLSFDCFGLWLIEGNFCVVIDWFWKRENFYLEKRFCSVNLDSKILGLKKTLGLKIIGV